MASSTRPGVPLPEPVAVAAPPRLWAALAVAGPAAGADLGLHQQPDHALPQATEPVGVSLEVFTDPVPGVHAGRGHRPSFGLGWTSKDDPVAIVVSAGWSTLSSSTTSVDANGNGNPRDLTPELTYHCHRASARPYR